MRRTGQHPLLRLRYSYTVQMVDDREVVTVRVGTYSPKQTFHLLVARSALQLGIYCSTKLSVFSIAIPGPQPCMVVWWYGAYLVGAVQQGERKGHRRPHHRAARGGPHSGMLQRRSRGHHSTRAVHDGERFCSVSGSRIFLSRLPVMYYYSSR